MQIQVDIGFEELLEIVKNLPEAQLLRLKNELGDKPKQHTKDNFRGLLLNGPTFSNEQIKAMEEAREGINKWRTK